MRRTLLRLASVSSAVLAAAVLTAGPVSAEPSFRPFDHDCRVGTACSPGLFTGLGGELPPGRRNLGG